MKSMFNEIAHILSTALKIDIASIDDNLSQKNCANWDSLRHLNLMFLIEEKYGISFEPEEIAEMLDIKSIISAIKEKLK